MTDFKPTQAQALVKLRFWDYLRRPDCIHTVTDVPPDVIVRVARSKQVAVWLSEPAFSAWFYDEQADYRKLFVEREPLFDLLLERLKDPGLPDGEFYKFMNLYAKLTGSFAATGKAAAPERLVTGDAVVDAMSDDEVQVELARAQPKPARPQDS